MDKVDKGGQSYDSKEKEVRFQCLPFYAGWKLAKFEHPQVKLKQSLQCPQLWTCYLLEDFSKNPMVKGTTNMHKEKKQEPYGVVGTW